MDSNITSKIILPFASTATALSIALIFQNIAQGNPTRLSYQEENPIIDNLVYEIRLPESDIHESLIIIHDFATKMTKETQDLPSKFADVINDNFFDLL